MLSETVALRSGEGGAPMSLEGAHGVSVSHEADGVARCY